VGGGAHWESFSMGEWKRRERGRWMNIRQLGRVSLALGEFAAWIGRFRGRILLDCNIEEWGCSYT
jgi:hypothetical protein